MIVELEKLASRRRFPRVAADVQFSISPVENEHAMALSVDVSEGGMRLQCIGLELDRGQLVRISLTLGRRTLSILGKVLRIHELDGHAKEVAVAFVDLDDESLSVLETYLLVN